MKCHFCGKETNMKKEECFGCDGIGCRTCDNTGKVTIIHCTNPNCDPPDHNLEPWDE